MRHFLTKHREEAMAQKRGGGAEHVALEDDSNADLQLPIEDDTLVFYREWAFTVIARALAVLEKEHALKPALFQTLKPWLDAASDLS